MVGKPFGATDCKTFGVGLVARILFLAHRIPYPPNKGDKIRSWHFLDHLMQQHEVHLGFYVDDKKDLEHIPFLEQKTASLAYECVSPAYQKLISLIALAKGKPLTLEAYPKRKLGQYASSLIETGQIDLVFLFSAATAPLVLGVKDRPLILADLVDVDSAKWEAYAKTALWPLSWLYAREAKLLGYYEKQVAGQAGATVFVSDDEADVFCQRSGLRSASKVFGLSNGVDTNHFSPERFPPREVSQPPTVIFTGAMNYRPNIEAVLWFVDEIWPKVRSVLPEAQFCIAGGPVAEKVAGLAKGNTHVSVLGYADDMAAEIARADIAIAPLLTARGIQNKVLEAMAMARPVVATPAAQEGIRGIHGHHLMVAEEAEQFATMVIDLIQNRAEARRLGEAARRYVQEHHSWQASFDRLDGIIEGLLKDKYD